MASADFPRLGVGSPEALGYRVLQFRFLQTCGYPAMPPEGSEQALLLTNG